VALNYSSPHNDKEKTDVTTFCKFIKRKNWNNYFV